MMKKFKTPREIKTMTNKQFIDYKHEIEQYARDLQEHIKEFGFCYKTLKEMVRDRIDELEMDLMEAEDHRMNCDLCEFDAQTRIH